VTALGSKAAVNLQCRGAIEPFVDILSNSDDQLVKNPKYDERHCGCYKPEAQRVGKNGQSLGHRFRWKTRPEEYYGAGSTHDHSKYQQSLVSAISHNLKRLLWVITSR